MNALTRKQAAEWCRNAGVPISESGNPEPEWLNVRFDLPSGADERRCLVDKHLKAFKSDARVLVWITEWGVWPSQDLMPQFIALRASVGETRGLREVPAQLVGMQNIDYLRDIVSCAVASLWDVHVFGHRGRKWVFYSHDEWGAASSAAIVEQIAAADRH